MEGKSKLVIDAGGISIDQSRKYQRKTQLSRATRNGSNNLNQQFSNAGFESLTGESGRNEAKFHLDGDRMIPNPALQNNLFDHAQSNPESLVSTDKREIDLGVT